MTTTCIGCHRVIGPDEPRFCVSRRINERSAMYVLEPTANELCSWVCVAICAKRNEIHSSPSPEGARVALESTHADSGALPPESGNSVTAASSVDHGRLPTDLSLQGEPEIARGSSAHLKCGFVKNDGSTCGEPWDAWQHAVCGQCHADGCHAFVHPSADAKPLKCVQTVNRLGFPIHFPNNETCDDLCRCNVRKNAA